MFKKIEVTRDKAESKRKELKKQGYISSYGISSKIRKGEIKINVTSSYFFTKLKKIVTESNDFHAACLKVCETGRSWAVDGRWWYKESELPKLVKTVLNI